MIQNVYILYNSPCVPQVNGKPIGTSSGKKPDAKPDTPDCQRRGSCESNPARSCREIRRRGGKGGAKDGNYFLRDFGTGKVSRSWCDMKTDGGGWQTLLEVTYDPKSKWTSKGRDNRQKAKVGNRQTYSWTQDQVYGRGVMTSFAGPSTEFMIVTTRNGKIKSRAKASVGTVTGGWFEDNSVQCWTMTKVSDGKGGPIRKKHKWDYKMKFPAQISHGSKSGSICGSGGSSRDSYWTKGGKDAWYSEFSFFTTGATPYIRIFDGDIKSGNGGLKILFRPRFHPSPVSVLGTGTAAYEDMETAGGGWFRVLRQTITKESGKWIRRSLGRTPANRRTDTNKPPPYSWVQQQAMGAGVAESRFGTDTEFLLVTEYDGRRKSVAKGVLGEIGSSWFGGGSECWILTKLINSKGKADKGTYHTQISHGTKNGQTCECGGRLDKMKGNCGTSKNSAWGGAGDYYMEYTFFDDGKGDHFRRIFNNNNNGETPRAMELWLRPPFYPDPRDLPSFATPNAYIDHATDGGGWLRVFKQTLTNENGWTRTSVGRMPTSRRVDKNNKAPPYEWVQGEVMGNGVLTSRFGDRSEFMIKTFYAGRLRSAVKGTIGDITSGWFEGTTMCLSDMVLLEDSGGVIRSQKTRTYRQLVAAGLKVHAIVVFNTQQGHVSCACNKNSKKYCGTSHNGYWVTSHGNQKDPYAEYSFYATKDGKAPTYRRIWSNNQNSATTRSFEIYVRPAP